MRIPVGTNTMENSMDLPQGIKTELMYNPAIPLLTIYPDKMKIIS